MMSSEVCIGRCDTLVFRRYQERAIPGLFIGRHRKEGSGIVCDCLTKKRFHMAHFDFPEIQSFGKKLVWSARMVR